MIFRLIALIQSTAALTGTAAVTYRVLRADGASVLLLADGSSALLLSGH